MPRPVRVELVREPPIELTADWPIRLVEDGVDAEGKLWCEPKTSVYQ